MTKKLVRFEVGDYGFDPVANTITLKNMDRLSLAQLSLIVNATDGIMLYCPIKPTLGASITNNVITLDCNTAGMSSTDDLQIYVDVPGTQEALIGITNQIALLADLVKSLANVDAANRQVVTIGGSPTVTATGTVILGGGAAAIGTVALGAGAAAIGTVTLPASTTEIGRVTQTYSDAQMVGQLVGQIAREKFNF